MTNKTKTIGGILVYICAALLIIISFFLPPQGIVDPSAMCGAGILLGGWQLLFGHNIKSIHIDKTGIHIDTHD